MKTPARPDYRVLERVLVCSFLAGCCIVGVSIWRENPRPSTKGTTARNLINARQLAAACELYAADHQGRFPSALDELNPHYVPPKELEELRRFNPERRREILLSWVYLGAGFEAKHPPRLLLAAPQAMAISGLEMRVVINGDGTEGVVSEGEYERLLAETVRQIKSLGQAQNGEASTPQGSAQVAK